MQLIKPSFAIQKHISYLLLLEVVSVASSFCYRSVVADSIADREKLIRARIKAGHESVIEHVGFSVKFTVDRAIAMEMVRHRLASFTQESTRYCNYADRKHIRFIMPPKVSEQLPEGLYNCTKSVIGDSNHYYVVSIDDILHECSKDVQDWTDAILDAESAYFTMIMNKWNPEMARSVLPNATAANIMVTANMREWRHIFKLRVLGTTGRPHPQIVEVMLPLLNKCKQEFPIFFDDL